MEIGKWLMVAGGLLLAAGVIVQFAPWLLGWFGRLPGDIRFEGERFRIFIPITSMLLVSLVLTILLYVARRFR